MLSLSSQYGAKSAVTGPNKKAAVTVGIIFDLASLGLVGAVTIMLFGFASVPLLGSGEPVSKFRIGDSVFRYDDGNAALFLAQIYSPTLDLSNFLPAFQPRGLSRPHRLTEWERRRILSYRRLTMARAPRLRISPRSVCRNKGLPIGG